MARITVEDCKKVVPNMFELVIIAANRAREMFFGSPSVIVNSDDSKIVLALREISNGVIDVNKLREEIYNRHKKRIHAKEEANIEEGASGEIEELIEAIYSTEIEENDYEDDISEESNLINMSDKVEQFQRLYEDDEE